MAMMEEELMLSKFTGALLGTGVGDALGMPVEGWSHQSIKKNVGQVREMLDGYLAAGHYTDDTEMMIGVAETLVEKGEFSGRLMAQRFIANFHSFRGYGGGTTRVLERIRAGWLWNEAAKGMFGSGSYGNGCAMRVAPVGLLYHNHPEELRKTAYKSSQITHANQLGKEGAALQAYAVALAVDLDPKLPFKAHPFCEKLIRWVESNIYKRKLEKLEELLNGEPDAAKVISELGVRVEAFNSVPTAIYSFLSHHDSFEEAVVYAVGLGGDADTIGAMTGAISGAYNGAEAIPQRWKGKLEDREYIEGLAKKLWLIAREKRPESG